MGSAGQCCVTLADVIVEDLCVSVDSHSLWQFMPLIFNRAATQPSTFFLPFSFFPRRGIPCDWIDCLNVDTRLVQSFFHCQLVENSERR